MTDLLLRLALLGASGGRPSRALRLTLNQGRLRELQAKQFSLLQRLWVFSREPNILISGRQPESSIKKLSLHVALFDALRLLLEKELVNRVVSLPPLHSLQYFGTFDDLADDILSPTLLKKFFKLLYCWRKCEDLFSSDCRLAFLD